MYQTGDRVRYPNWSGGWATGTVGVGPYTGRGIWSWTWVIWDGGGYREVNGHLTPASYVATCGLREASVVDEIAKLSESAGR